MAEYLENRERDGLQIISLIRYCIHDCGVSPSIEHWTLLIALLVAQETESILLALVEALQLAERDAGNTSKRVSSKGASIANLDC